MVDSTRACCSGNLRLGCRAQGPKKLTEVVKVLDLARANNVFISLTQLAEIKSKAA